MDRSTRRALLEQLVRDGEQLAADFGLRYRAIEAEPTHVRSRYGVCFADGTIRIRLRHARTGRPLKYSSLVNTLCHELAHLRHFDHGLRFRRFYAQILEFARDSGLYQPRASAGIAALPRAPRAAPAPRASDPPGQLSLFGGGG